MCKRPFVVDLQSTRGAATQTLEVQRTALTATDGVLAEYVADGGEHVHAFAARVASRLRGETSMPNTASLLDAALAKERLLRAPIALAEEP